MSIYTLFSGKELTKVDRIQSLKNEIEKLTVLEDQNNEREKLEKCINQLISMEEEDYVLGLSWYQDQMSDYLHD
jgi:hypothetical protein